MKTVFFGTPALAVPALRALAETTEVVGVVCQPDRPAGRGLRVTAPAIKDAAEHLGLIVHQPKKVRTGTLDEWIRARDADAAIVLAYGRILPERVLEAPRLGCFNLHASLLPRYRGAAPINWALIRGESETGISLMRMDEGLDTGPVYCERRIEIGRTDNAGTLSTKLGELAGEVVRCDLPRVLEGTLEAIPQNDTDATYAPPLTKADLRLDWQGSAEELENRVRGLAPLPAARTTLRGKTLKVLAVRRAELPMDQAPPGTVVRADPGATLIATGRGALKLIEAQVEGRRAVRARDLVNGRQIRVGDVLGS